MTSARRHGFKRVHPTEYVLVVVDVVFISITWVCCVCLDCFLLLPSRFLCCKKGQKFISRHADAGYVPMLWHW